MRVAILHDPVGDASRPDERDVLAQVEAVSQGLHRLGHRAEPLALIPEPTALAEALRRRGAELVFNLVEAIAGQGRLIYLAPALLDALGMRYTGAPTEAMFLTSHKLLAKRWLRAHALPTPDWLHDEHGSRAADERPCSPREPDEVWAEQERWIVKSVWEDASLGLEDDAVVVAADREALERLVRARADRLGGQAFAERFVEGREFNLSLLAGAQGPQVLPPAEIRFDAFPPQKPRLVGYRAKWDEQSFEYHHTPRSFALGPEDAPLVAELESLARACWRLFGLRGYGRVDFRVDARGRPTILEVNINPCLSFDAGLMAAAERAGLSIEAVVERIVADVGLHPTEKG